MKKRYPLFIVASTTVMISLACVIPGMAPVATPTTPPTETPTATATATPIPPTETPVPTATPNHAATQAYLATQTYKAQSEEAIKVLQKIKYATDTGSLAWYQRGDQSIDLVDYGNYSYIPFGDGKEYSNFVLKSDVTWNTEGIMTCGFMMRSDEGFDKGGQYLFQFLHFSGLPAWDIEFYEAKTFKTIITGQMSFSSALDLDNGATNRFVIIAEDNKFTVYINNRRQGSYYDWSKLASRGQFAFFASHESGAANCTFTDTWIWELK